MLQDNVGEYMFNDVDGCHGVEHTCNMAGLTHCGTTTASWRTEGFTCKEGAQPAFARQAAESGPTEPGEDGSIPSLPSMPLPCHTEFFVAF